MNDLLKNIKGLKLGKKNVVMICIAVLIMALLFISELTSSAPSETITAENTVQYSAEYIQNTEKELELLLKQISGAGNVKVMITLESCYENVFAKGYDEKKNNSDNSQQYESKEEYIIVKKGSNTEECLVIKVYEPTIKGVAVIAEGAGNAHVKNAITQTVCALFDISSAKVSVEKMNNN